MKLFPGWSRSSIFCNYKELVGEQHLVRGERSIFRPGAPTCSHQHTGTTRLPRSHTENSSSSVVLTSPTTLRAKWQWQRYNEDNEDEGNSNSKRPSNKRESLRENANGHGSESMRFPWGVHWPSKIRILRQSQHRHHHYHRFILSSPTPANTTTINPPCTRTTIFLIMQTTLIIYRPRIIFHCQTSQGVQPLRVCDFPGWSDGGRLLNKGGWVRSLSTTNGLLRHFLNFSFKIQFNRSYSHE